MRKSYKNNNNSNLRVKVVKEKGHPSSAATSSHEKSPDRYNSSPPKIPVR